MPYQYRREPLTQEEADRISKVCETHQEKLIIWTLLDTGLRVSEFANLKTENMDWQRGTLTIYGKGGPYGSVTKRRILPLTIRAKELLHKHFAIYNDIGMTKRTVQRIVKRLANKASISRPVTPHVLRHTFAVTVNHKGIGLATLQKLLGHDRITTTQIYLNLAPEDILREFREKW